MEETEWLESARPGHMLSVLQSPSPRKLRLFMCACVRQYLHLFVDQESVKVIGTAERFADGIATQSELLDCHKMADIAWREYRGAIYHDLTKACDSSPLGGALCVAIQDSHSQQEDKADWIRDIFGIPMRPEPQIPFVTRDVQAIASTIYWERTFEDMPILADALEDAGCEAYILDHARSGKPHTRGCWLLDIILGKH